MISPMSFKVLDMQRKLKKIQLDGWDNQMSKTIKNR